MAGRRQISIEVGDDIHARFLEAHGNAGKFGKRALAVDCLNVAWSIKELDIGLFRSIQAAMESGNLTLDNLAICLEASRKISGSSEKEKPDLEPEKPDLEPEKPARKTAASGMANLII